jgi:hypothetical protein
VCMCLCVCVYVCVCVSVRAKLQLHCQCTRYSTSLYTQCILLYKFTFYCVTPWTSLALIFPFFPFASNATLGLNLFTFLKRRSKVWGCGHLRFSHLFSTLMLRNDVFSKAPRYVVVLSNCWHLCLAVPTGKTHGASLQASHVATVITPLSNKTGQGLHDGIVVWECVYSTYFGGYVMIFSR